MIKLSSTQQGILSGLLAAGYTVRVYKHPRAIIPVLLPENTLYGDVSAGPQLSRGVQLRFRIIPKKQSK
jgi:hypothetical protein